MQNQDYITPSRARLVSPNEHKLISRYCHITRGTERLFVLYLIIRFTGLRISEALALTVADVYDGFEVRRVLSATTAKQRGKKRLRNLSLCSPRDILRTELRKFIYPRRKKGNLDWLQDFLFETASGKAYERCSSTHDLYKLCDKAGIPRFSWHDLRHGYGQEIYDMTGDTTLVTAALGHASSRTTQKYLHPGISQLHDINVAIPKV